MLLDACEKEETADNPEHAGGMKFWVYCQPVMMKHSLRNEFSHNRHFLLHTCHDFYSRLSDFAAVAVA